MLSGIGGVSVAFIVRSHNNLRRRRDYDNDSYICSRADTLNPFPGKKREGRQTKGVKQEKRGQKEKARS
jgi:hypothetical protein